MKKLITTTTLALLCVSGAASAKTIHTEFNGDYAFECDSLTMTFSVTLGGGTITTKPGSIILDSDGATVSVNVPLNCENPEVLTVDTATLHGNTVQACHDFENNDNDQWVAENLPCETIATASTAMFGWAALGLAPALYESLEMSVVRSGNWFFRWIGLDQVNWTAVSTAGEVTSGSNILINKYGKWGSFNMKGIAYPVSGEFEGVSLTGCALTETRTFTGNADLPAAEGEPHYTSAKSVVDQDATCTAEYGEDLKLAVNASFKVTARYSGYAE